METYKCVKIERDSTNKPITYHLQDTNGGIRLVAANTLKGLMRTNAIAVSNLTLTRDNRLVPSERAARKAVKKCDYHNFQKEYIGGSDYCTLIMVGPSQRKFLVQPLKFGEDGTYMAYIVNEEAEIGSYYTRVATFKHWLKIYDDDSLVKSFNANKIVVYRSGKFGCIIQLFTRG